MTETAGCIAQDCASPAVCRLQRGAYCRGHFISACYERMDEYARQVQERRLRDAATDILREFLSECSRQAVELAESAADLDNLERARLLDILLRATDLSQYLRRSPRLAAIHPIRLRSDKLGRVWEQDTRTRVLSRYGALVEVRQAVENDDVLTLEWPERNKQARVRVAWVNPRGPNQFAIGLEFIDVDNFWELDWTRIGTSSL